MGLGSSTPLAPLSRGGKGSLTVAPWSPHRFLRQKLISSGCGKGLRSRGFVVVVVLVVLVVVVVLAVVVAVVVVQVAEAKPPGKEAVFFGGAPQRFLRQR